MLGGCFVPLQYIIRMSFLSCQATISISVGLVRVYVNNILIVAVLLEG